MGSGNIGLNERDQPESRECAGCEVGPDHRFQCPKHKSKYQPDGTFISGRATRNIDRHPIKREGHKLVVDVETMIRSDKDPAAWGAAVVRV